MKNYWHTAHLRSMLFQGTTLLVVLGVGAFLYLNMKNNLEKQSIATGFAFLQQEASFAIGETSIHYDPSHSYLKALGVGALNTVITSLVGIFFASLLGVGIGVARLSSNWLLSRSAKVYIEFIRNIPLLLQLFFWYSLFTEVFPNVRNAYAPFGEGAGVYLSNRGLYFPLLRWEGLMAPTLELPILGGFNFSGGAHLSPEFCALLLGLTLYTGAFIGVIVRSGIQSVDQGQREAAQALGLSDGQTLRLVVFPQAMRLIIPPLTSQYLNLLKNSSLAVAIGYPDFVGITNTTINQTGQAIEGVALIMLFYLSCSLLTSLFMNWYNSKMKLVQR